VFEKTLGARVGARASASGANFRLLTLKDVAHMLLAIFVLGATATLFFGWLMILNSPRLAGSGFGADADCVSLGRGGVYCAKDPTVDRRSNAGSGLEEDCATLGKGGRVCAKHP
jgi:hypothetical protein